MGIATRIGTRNIPMQGDENRVFGMKTIRDDKPEKVNISLACAHVLFIIKNMGNESNVRELICPEKYCNLGIYKKDFDKVREK